MNVYSLVADCVVVAHLAYVAFVVFGLLAILLGGLCRWNWVRNKWFRLVHISMIGIVVFEALMSITCPLTTLEVYLRNQGNEAVTGGSFVGRLAHHLLFFDLSPQFFTIAYCCFGALILATFFFVPVRWTGRSACRRR